MTYNIGKYRRIYAETGAYKSVSQEDLQLLVDGDTSVTGIDVSSETLALICDLGSRYRVSRIVYHRDEATSESIQLWGRQGPTEDYEWESISLTTVESTYVEIDLSSVASKFRELRLRHAVSTGTSTVYELEVFASDRDVEFGYSGEYEKMSVDSGQCVNVVEGIPLFNPTTSPQTFYALLDADDADSFGVKTSLTSSGVFAGVYERGVNIPADFPWGNGSFVSTAISGTSVALASGTLSGKYYTPVIDISGLDGRRFFWDATLSGSNVVDSPSVDSVFTVEIRLDNTMPSDIGWSSGQLSDDSNWSLASGTLPFIPIDNNHIFSSDYFDYFQACVTFDSTVMWETALLNSIGVEEGLAFVIPAKDSATIYLHSSHQDHYTGRETGLLTWFFESRNEEQ